MTALTPLKQQFLEKQQIHIDDEIDGEMAEYVHECMQVLKASDNPPVDIYIRCLGGGAQSSLFIYDLIRFYEGPTRGIVTSFAHSGGAIILQACAERWAYPHASILVHYGRISEGTYFREDFSDRKKAKAHADDLTYYRDRIEDILMARTKRSRSVIRALCHKDKEMTAKEAVKLNLVDNILKPPSR